MANFVNIPLGLKTTTQIPLNIKKFAGSETLLKDLGLNNNLAFTYHKHLEVTCMEEGTKWEWREVELGEENTGLLDLDFTYPPSLIAFGVDYSNKKYNFFPITEGVLPPLELIDEGNGNGIIIRGRDPLNYGPIGLGAVDLSFSDSPSSTKGASADYTFAAGLNNRASSLGALSIGRDNISSQDDCVTLGKSNTATSPSAISIGNFSITTGHYAASLGNGLKARSWAETVVGAYNTDYTPLNISSKNLLDRAFVVGNGSASFSPSDAFIILKNGLATLPSVTTALIAAEVTGKAVVTREYLEANAGGTPDATTLVKGKLKLANDLGGTADLPTTPTAVHITGNEIIHGQKNFNDIVGGSATTIQAIKILTEGNLVDIQTGSELAGGTLVSINSTSSNAATNSAKLLVLNAGSLSVGMPFTVQNDGVTTFTITKQGNATANSYIKQGGLSTEYLMADGSVSSGVGIQSITRYSSWLPNQGTVLTTTLGVGKTILNIIPTLVCLIANNGYAVGDIVSISPTQANDSGGLADSGVSIRFREDTSDRFTFNVNDRLDIPNCYNGAISSSGAITDPVSAIPSEWNLRIVITYI